jgi:hypothetical protein
MYDNAYVCRRDHKNQNYEVDTGNLPYDGTLPGCFFSINVMKGVFDYNTGNFKLTGL